MQSNNDIVSRVVNSVRALTKDDHISRRYVLKVARSKASFLIAQKYDEGSLFLDSSLYTPVPCFEMEQEDIVRCDIVEFRRCTNLMKSKKRLPNPVYGKYGAAIGSVTNLEDSKIFEPTTPTRFINNSKIPNFNLYSKNKYYEKDGYLYLVNSTVEAVNLSLITLHQDEVGEVSGCMDKDPCKSIWDYEFKCPDKLLEAVIRDTVTEVVQTWRQITPDENPNDDANQRTQTEA